MTPTLRKAAEAAKEARKTWQRIHDSFNSGRPTLHYHCHPNDMQFLLDLADDALKAALAKQPAPSLNTDMHSILVASTELVEELPKGCDANDTGAGTPTPTTNATSPGVKSGASEHISSLIDKWADVLEIPSGSFVNEDLRGASAHILFLSAKLAEAERELTAARNVATICVGRPIIEILANEGAWHSQTSANCLVAADDLNGQNPYSQLDAALDVIGLKTAEIDGLNAKLAEAERERERTWCLSCGTVSRNGECDCTMYGEHP